MSIPRELSNAFAPAGRGLKAVSYTHLRAHETEADLVCRLLLETFQPETTVELIGPTAGCYPDPLFSRGIDSVGGSAVVDTERAIECVRAGRPWLESVRKYSLSKETYPGHSALFITS